MSCAEVVSTGKKWAIVLTSIQRYEKGMATTGPFRPAWDAVKSTCLVP